LKYPVIVTSKPDAACRRQADATEKKAASGMVAGRALYLALLSRRMAQELGNGNL